MRRVALVHDYLCGVGGSERVFLEICRAFPDADIFTLAYNPKKTLDEFKEFKINTTFMNFFVGSMAAFRFTFPINIFAMRFLDFSKYDLIISSSASVAKYINKHGAVHVCYMYYPTRAIWEGAKYFGSSRLGKLMSLLLYFFRKLDAYFVSEIDSIITLSAVAQKQIKKCYCRGSQVIASPFNEQSFFFVPEFKKSDSFLLVSRLEEWKRVEYAIDAFNSLGLPLNIVGEGKNRSLLEAKANSNIVFLGRVGDEELRMLYNQARAVVFTPILEYGLIPIEAYACGTPVICVGKSGVLETSKGIFFDEPANSFENVCAVFFREQSSMDLEKAVKFYCLFEREFKTETLLRSADKFTSSTFRMAIKEACINVVDSRMHKVRN